MFPSKLCSILKQTSLSCSPFKFRDIIAKRLSTKFKEELRVESTTTTNHKTRRKKSDSKFDFDTLGTWDNRIDLPLLLQASIERGKPIPWIRSSNASAASVIGRRITNEDRYKVKELKPYLLYCAVFDGHGHSTCAEYCNEHMEEHILYWLNKDENMDLEEVLEVSFREVNNSFARYVAYHCLSEDEFNSGTTATVCLLKNSVKLVVAHVGDSRAILCRDGDARKLTIDHSTHLKTEKDRILKSGGFVKYDSLERGLVNGRLAMTRSIGDLNLKSYGVIAVPDTRTIEVEHGRDAFLILTTDGINFVMNDQEICSAVNNCHNPEDAASLVTDQAMQFASEDNATALIVPFGAWGKYRNQGNITYNFLRHLSQSVRY